MVIVSNQIQMNNALNLGIGHSSKRKYSFKNKHAKTQRTTQLHYRKKSVSWVKASNLSKAKTDLSPILPRQSHKSIAQDPNQLQQNRNCCIFFEKRTQRLDFLNFNPKHMRKSHKQNVDCQNTKSTSQNFMNLTNHYKHQSIESLSRSLAFFKRIDNTVFNPYSTFASTSPEVITLKNANQFTQSNLQRNSNLHKQKLSLTQNCKTIRGIKSKVFACIKYSDLKQSNKLGQKKQIAATKQLIQLSNNNFIKTLCHNFNKQSEGCICEPKCEWMMKWLAIEQERSFEFLTDTHKASQHKTIQQIEKDIYRTYSSTPTFQNPFYISQLKELLVYYSKLDEEVGYVQGMNMIAACIVYHSTNFSDSLILMHSLMKSHNLRSIYLKDLSLSYEMSKKLVLQLRQLCFDLYSYLIKQGVQLQLFLTSWYLSLLGTFIPLAEMYLVVDSFMLEGFVGVNKIIITLLIYMREELMTLQEQSLLLCFSVQQMTRRAEKINWRELIQRSFFLKLGQLQF